MEINEVPRVKPGLDDVVANLIKYSFYEDDVMQSSERDLFCQEVRTQITDCLKDNFHRYDRTQISSLNMRCEQVAKELELISLALYAVQSK